MRIPGFEECFRLMDQYAMLPNIRQHSAMVAGVAEHLVNTLVEHDSVGGQAPDKELVVAGALLHDIAKTPCLSNGCDHAALGAQICAKHGYPEIAGIVEEHVILRDHAPDRYQQGVFTAREIVYYSDKRVMHEHVVSLEKRLDYILEHYGRNDQRIHQRIQENFAKCLVLEQHLFSFMPFSPIDLPLLVKPFVF